MPKPKYEYIGNGACGCIISDPNDARYVYKLFRDEKERNIEFATNKAIQTITTDFTLNAIETRNFKRDELDDKLVARCEVFDLEGDDEDEFDEYEGDDEDDKFTTKEQREAQKYAYNKHKEELQKENVFLKKQPIPAIQYEKGGMDLDKASKTMKFSTIFTHMHRIFSGLIELDTNGWVHRDIKPANIVYTNDKTHFALIDFGSTFKFSKIKEPSETSWDWELYTSLRVPYSFFPPELPEFAAKLKQNDTCCIANEITRQRDQNYRSLLTDLEYQHKLLSEKKPRNIEYINIISTFIDRCELYIKYTIHDANEINYDTNKIDVYMLGVTLLDVMLKCMYHDKYDITEVANYYVGHFILLLNVVRTSLP
jgi:serine/threonine protein kinase